MVRLGEKNQTQIKNIGLFNSKSRNVYQLSKILISEHNGKVPSTRDALVKLPGLEERQQMLF